MTFPLGPAGQAPPAEADGPTGSLVDAQADALAGLIRAGHAVQRRPQFFIWAQTQLQPLLAHRLLVCAAYQRPRRDLVFDVFNNVVLSHELITGLSEPRSALLLLVAEQWVKGRGRPQLLQLESGRAGPAAGQLRLLQQELGSSELLVHGVSRPQRRDEIESLFILGGLAPLPHTLSQVPQTGAAADPDAGAGHTAWLDLLMPYLHSIWLRVVHNELERPRDGVAMVLTGRAPPPARGPRPAITEREVQILRWVQQGCSNLQIAELLLISPLTVKNHVQKILRKLDANNRTQAVSRAIALGALQLSPDSSPGRAGQIARPAPPAPMVPPAPLAAEADQPDAPDRFQV